MTSEHEPPPVLRTERLVIRPFTYEDDAFIVELLNDPAFIEHIQDRGVRSLTDARDYLTHGPMAGYEQHGLGLCCVERRSGGESIGMCGLLQRSTLPVPDLGYAFLPSARRQGFAYEASAAVLEFARSELGLDRVLAVTNKTNDISRRLLEKLGFSFSHLAEFEPDSEKIPCYERIFTPRLNVRV